ncbi:MAG: hypothetical protein AVDCRST_MAG08-3554, partial [uncultured Acetobacteraceae bacterium]
GCAGARARRGEGRRRGGRLLADPGRHQPRADPAPGRGV